MYSISCSSMICLRCRVRAPGPDTTLQTDDCKDVEMLCTVGAVWSNNCSFCSPYIIASVRLAYNKIILKFRVLLKNIVLMHAMQTMSIQGQESHIQPLGSDFGMLITCYCVYHRMLITRKDCMKRYRPWHLNIINGQQWQTSGLSSIEKLVQFSWCHTEESCSVLDGSTTPFSFDCNVMMETCTKGTTCPDFWYLDAKMAFAIKANGRFLIFGPQKGFLIQGHW